MKRAFVVLALAAMLAGALIWRACAVVADYSRERLPLAEAVSGFLLREDYLAAREVIGEMQKLWPKDRKRLAIYLDHSHLDDIQQLMETIRSACEVENSDAAAYSATLVDILTHLPDMNRLWLENFL